MIHTRNAALFFSLTLVWTGTALLISPAIVVFWERQPLASLWLKPFCWQSIAWGLPWWRSIPP